MTVDEQYMQRCIDLALKGSGQVAPNPMVGAVLVYQNRIIGEGWHRAYGTAHAEVNCIHSVAEEDRSLIPSSQLYVSLEPCVHHGKTPPCTDLILQYKIPEVIIGCQDSFHRVSGRGIQKLEEAGVTVRLGILEQDCRWLNRRFFVKQELKRPYIFLKWAQSIDGFLAPDKGKKVMLSDKFSQQRVQKMRAEEDAILIGYRTALYDDPQLSNRFGYGKQPIRIVIDPEMALPISLNILQPGPKTLIFNYHKEDIAGNLQWIKINNNGRMPEEVVDHLAETDINSVIIEGGYKTLHQFIEAGLWDESLVFYTPCLLQSGTPAPVLTQALQHQIHYSNKDTIINYHHAHNRRLFKHQ